MLGELSEWLGAFEEMSFRIFVLGEVNFRQVLELRDLLVSLDLVR